MRTRLLTALAAATFAMPLISTAASASEAKCDDSVSADHKRDDSVGSEHKCEEAKG